MLHLSLDCFLKSVCQLCPPHLAKIRKEMSALYISPSRRVLMVSGRWERRRQATFLNLSELRIVSLCAKIILLTLLSIFPGLLSVLLGSVLTVLICLLTYLTTGTPLYIFCSGRRGCPASVMPRAMPGRLHPCSCHQPPLTFTELG